MGAKKPVARSAREDKDATRIKGQGYVLVDLQSPNAQLWIMPDKHGREMVDRMNDWNGDVIGYGTVARVEGGERAIIPLSRLFAANNFNTLSIYAAPLHAALGKQAAQRRKMLEGLLEQDKPMDFGYVVEALMTQAGKPIVVTTEDGREFGGIMRHAQYRFTWGGDAAVVVFHAFTWQAGKMVMQHREELLHPRPEACSLRELGVRVATPDDIARLTARGRRVVELNSKFSYVQITKRMDVRRFWSWESIPAVGRAIVDKVGMMLYAGRDMAGEERPDLPGDTVMPGVDPHFCVDPYLFVFSFYAKAWGRVHVDELTTIEFRSDAFDSLVMPPDDKKLLYTLVKNNDATTRSDFIESKGGGCVMLLHGEPGVGKTLTAEAVAEVLRRPLYSVSAGELGTTAEILEQKLKQVLQTAERWGAVLLLDEADVLLEQRGQGDVARNAIVCTFLKLLEYYNGVLILTTNRVSEIDKAFYGRVSFALNYPRLGQNARAQVTRHLLRVNGMEHLDSDIAKIAASPANGRQLKNAIRLSKCIAKEEERNVTVQDVMTVLNRLIEFSPDELEKRVTHSLGNGADAE